MKTTSIRVDPVISKKLKALKDVLGLKNINDVLNHLIKNQINSFSDKYKNNYNVLVNTLLGRKRHIGNVIKEIQYPSQLYQLLKLVSHYDKKSVSDIVIDMIKNDFSNNPKITKDLTRIVKYKINNN